MMEISININWTMIHSEEMWTPDFSFDVSI